MHRRQFLHTTGLASAGLLLSRLSFAGSFAPDYNIRMLSDRVGIFTERGGTIGLLLGKDGNLFIDSQFPDTVVHAIDEVKKRNEKAVTLLLNTHHHGDHTGGNIAFKGLAEKVVAHENCLKNLKAVSDRNNTVEKQFFPGAVFSDHMELKLGDEKIKAHYFGPAHTNGDAVYHFQNDNIMHVGDLMFNKRHPYIDRSAGANIENWMKVLDKIIATGDKHTRYIFGHSLNAGEETGTAEDLKKFQDYLGKVLAFAEKEFARGVSKEEFLKNTSIPGVTEWSGSGIERPLTASYEEVSEKQKA